MPPEVILHIMKFMDTDSLRKITTLAKVFYELWFTSPQLWENFYSEEDYFDSRVVEILVKYVSEVKHFTAKFKHEYEGNQPLNHIMFSMYNLLTLNLAGCEIIYNVDFLQVMSNITVLNVSMCRNMSTGSLIRSVNSMPRLREFICRGNDVRVSAFSIYQAVRGLETLQKIDCCDSGVMRPWLARKLLHFCENITEFKFTTLFSLDDDRAKVSWYKLVKVKFPHVSFTQRVLDKVEEYMDECRAVRMEALLHDWVQQALEFNPPEHY